MMVVKGVSIGKFTAFELFALLLFCLASLTFTLVRCSPNSIERDLEIDCKWNGAPVSASLKWTEPKDDPATTANADAESKTSQSGAANSKANTATISTQQALMLTGAASGAALAGGGTLAVKKKLEGGNSSEKETKQTASTSATSSTAPKGTSLASPSSGREMLMQHQNELKSSTQGQSTTQSQSSTQSQQSKQSNDPPKNDGPPTTAGQQYMQKQMNSQSSQQSQPTTQTQRLVQSDVQNYQKEPTSTSSTIAASAATITKDLLMHKQMDSLTKQSVSSTSKQANGTQQPKQVASTSTSTTSQNIGLLASSSSAARIAKEMWPQRQKEFERLAKQRSDLAAKFSTPYYYTGLASSFTSATGNTWARLQGFGSAIGNGLNKVVATVKPYTPYISMALCLALIVSSVFTFGATAPITGAAMAGTGISISQGAGLVGAGIAIGGMGMYAAHNLGIMNYPQQPTYEVKHTQMMQQPQMSDIKERKGSGPYGEDVAQEQLEQTDIRMDTIIQPHGGPLHQESMEQAHEWLERQGERFINIDIKQYGIDEKGRLVTRRPDLTSDHYLVQCKTGEEPINKKAYSQAWDDLLIATQKTERTHENCEIVYWYLKRPSPNDTKLINLIRWLEDCGITVKYGEDFIGGG